MNMGNHRTTIQDQGSVDDKGSYYLAKHRMELRAQGKGLGSVHIT